MSRASQPDTDDLSTTARYGPLDDTERSEEAFVAVLREALSSSPLWPRARGYRTVVSDEVETLHGRVDLLLGTLPSAHRLPPEAAYLYCQPTCCRILASLFAKQPKDVLTLCREVGVTRRTCTTWLNMMADEGLVRRVNGDAYVLGSRARRRGISILSIEAKLRNWQRALYQATRYRTFSDRSFVVMPTRFVGPAAANIERFRRARIGLASMDRIGRVRVHTAPRARRPVESPHVWMAAGRVLLHSAV